MVKYQIKSFVINGLTFFCTIKIQKIIYRRSERSDTHSGLVSGIDDFWVFQYKGIEHVRVFLPFGSG